MMEMKGDPILAGLAAGDAGNDGLINGVGNSAPAQMLPGVASGPAGKWVVYAICKFKGIGQKLMKLGAT